MTSSARPSFDRAVLLFIYEVIVIDINWEHIKAEYLIGGISQRDLAKKHGVSFNTLKDVANKEQWKSLQTEIKAIATTKAQQLLIDDEVEQQLKLHNIRGQLIDILLDKIKTMPEYSGTEHTEKRYTDKDDERLTTEDKWNIATIFNIYSALINEDLKRAKLELEKDKEWQ